jgi:TolB protein
MKNKLQFNRYRKGQGIFMKKSQITKIVCVMILLLATTGCSAERERDNVTVKEPGGSLTIIDNPENETEDTGISVVRIDPYEKLEITDWLDSDTVIVSKENESLGKMSLAELSDSYPRSIYLYNLKTKEYKLLQEDADLNLGGATLSPDKKNLLYYGNSLGDPSYYVLNLENQKSFTIAGEPIGNAGSANWADKDTVIGAGYTNGAYTASTEGKITVIKELEDKAVFLVKQINDTIYYNTSDDNTLMALNLSTKETVSLNLANVFGVYPSPDEKQILVLQYKGSQQALLLCDTDGSNTKIIAEGIELGGVSWSPDQRMIVYNMKGEGSGTGNSGLYLYDLLTDENTRIAVDVEGITTSFSPSGKEFAFTQWDGKQYNSSIVHLEDSLQK